MSSHITKQQVLLGLSVAFTVAVVLLGWMFTVLPSLKLHRVLVKEQFQETQSDVAQEWAKTQTIQQPVPSVFSDVKQLVEFAQTKEHISQQLIETLKTRIESEAYASQKTSIDSQNE